MTREGPTIQDIREAAARIRAYVHRTPILTCGALNRMVGSELFFKCENFQKAGAFKIRGAMNAALNLSARETAAGLATHSSGNHAAAIALAARRLETKAYVVMPENSPSVKVDAVAGYGGEITFCKPTLEAREEGLAEVVAATGAAVIHPYNDDRVIAGQGTAALELCEDVPGLDVIMAPVGGGGLLAGTAIAVSVISPGTAVVATEPERADDAFRSFRAGRIISSENPDTVADGLRTSLGDRTFPIILEKVDEIVTVGEESIVQAMRLVWERMKIIVEPSAAVPLAAIIAGRLDVSGKRTGIILSGGNVDLATLPWKTQ